MNFYVSTILYKIINLYTHASACAFMYLQAYMCIYWYACMHPRGYPEKIISSPSNTLSVYTVLYSDFVCINHLSALLFFMFRSLFFYQYSLLKTNICSTSHARFASKFSVWTVQTTSMNLKVENYSGLCEQYIAKTRPSRNGLHPWNHPAISICNEWVAK